MALRPKPAVLGALLSLAVLSLAWRRWRRRLAKLNKEAAPAFDTLVDTVLGLRALELACKNALLRATVYPHLSRIHLCNTGLSDGMLPKELYRLTHVTVVDLSNNELGRFPDGLAAMPGLRELNVGRNRLTSLPEAIGDLTELRVLNVYSNAIVSLPESVGNLRKLERFGLKSNLLADLPTSIGDLESLVELYLTDNKLTALPASLGRCKKLRKLQASFNDLRSLPAELQGLDSLELFRVAVNPSLAYVPPELTSLPSLCWVSLAGCAWCPERPPHEGLEELKLAELEPDDSNTTLQEEPEGGSSRGGGSDSRGSSSSGSGDSSLAGANGGPVPGGRLLGEGASGDVYAAVLRGRRVAVKAFVAAIGPDGSAADELAVACFVEHSALPRALGVVRQPRLSLVMELCPGKPLAEKPNFSSVLRCRWPPDVKYRDRFVLSVGMHVARALEYLHAHGIAHGDVYAHNVLADEDGRAVLCDFGASFFYPPEPLPPPPPSPRSPGNNADIEELSAAAAAADEAAALAAARAASLAASGGRYCFEALEVRAFGLLMGGLASRARGGGGLAWIEEDLVRRCAAVPPQSRPTFTELANLLEAELLQLYPQTPMDQTNGSREQQQHFFSTGFLASSVLA